MEPSNFSKPLKNRPNEALNLIFRSADRQLPNTAFVLFWIPGDGKFVGPFRVKEP